MDTPGIATRFMIGLLLLKHIYGLSDEGVCERWVHDPYFQYFTGEEFFQHTFLHERSDLSHWRKRLGDKLELLLAESIVTNNRRSPGGLIVLHARALPDNPYDGHTLRDVIDRTETLTGCAIERAYVNKGYRGHDAQNPRRIFISGQKRGVFGVIKRELRRRSAIEPIIGHLKADGHLGRCYLKGRAGDPAMRLTSSSQPSATTSAASSPGSENSCASSCSSYGARSAVPPGSIRLLNGRLSTLRQNACASSFEASG
ncbi:Transposase domain [Bradyrhizobium brasilense]|uniref:Transposase domain n=1 Tax=Bradyrhizobium brasilense TaxID=1419277 RepID=A0A1G6U094_9BRAD|nr:Transposase domain [Bradyrhizobium brasilense]